MSQTERRHERLAVRLSLIISRLVAGETLDMGLLAAEFGVSLRTLRRDFRERLMYLDLEYRDGTCRLLSGSHQRELAVLTFARQSGVEALFPDMDNHMVSSLLSGPGESPCLIWAESESLSPPRPGIFTRLVRAISEHRRVTLLAEGCRCTIPPRTLRRALVSDWRASSSRGSVSPERYPCGYLAPGTVRARPSDS